MQCQGRSLRRTRRKAKPLHTFSPKWKFSLFLPFSLLSVLTLAALLQGAGSNLLEALSVSHFLSISVCDQIGKRGLSTCYKLREKESGIYSNYTTLIRILHLWAL